MRQVPLLSLPVKTRRDIRQLTYAALHHSRITIPSEEREQLGSLDPFPTINKLNRGVACLQKIGPRICNHRSAGSCSLERLPCRRQPCCRLLRLPSNSRPQK